jgi:hypothetical protein
MSFYNILIVAVALSVCLLKTTKADPATADVVVVQLSSGDAKQVETAVDTIRSSLVSDPIHAVDRLNERWMAALNQAKQYNAVQEFAVVGTLAVPADPWRIEQLLRHRVRALLAQGKAKEALSAAKAEFLVSGMGQTAHDLDLLAQCFKAAYPQDPTIEPRFRVQQLAGAQTPRGGEWNTRSTEREKNQLLKHGRSLLADVPVDPTLWQSGIPKYVGKTDFKGLTALGNLYLLCGQVKEARVALERAYEVAPPRELRSASEGLAKSIKAEDCSIGRANAFVLAIRPAFDDPK